MKKESPKEITIGTKIFIISISLIVGVPILLIAAVLYTLWGVILYISVWLTGRKRYVLFVYSDSPIWKEYIEKEMVPHLQEKAVILNWSERKSWRNSLATLVFRYFGGSRNFNPIAIVFHPFQIAKTYRFYQAFKTFKHGNVKEVEELRNQLFRDLKVQST